MSLSTILGINAIVILMMMVALWLISIRIKDVSIVDIFWGLGFVVIAWVTAFSINSWSVVAILLPTLVTIWGFRLAGYLFWRNHGKPEDARYQKMREHRGSSFWWRSLYVVFLLQGVIMWIVSLPLQTGLLSANQSGFTLVTAMGCLLWVIGFLFESLGDYQLAKFKANPENAGQVMDKGLWRYTRHPNYFGDFMVWWGYYFIALGQGVYWWSAIGPIIMSIFLMKFSGVGLLEKSLKQSKPQYEKYIKTTSSFFPTLPTQSSE